MKRKATVICRTHKKMFIVLSLSYGKV